MRYFFADPHFGDSDIIRYENRPFKNSDEMNRAIVENWNSVISEDDEVFLLGDVVGSNPMPIVELQKVLSQLKGKIIILLGNHDIGIANYLIEWGYKVYEYPILLDDFWILSHEPQYIQNGGVYANIFGHVHNNPMYKTVSSRSYCVCAERINYTPISFEIIKKKIREVSEIND